MNDTSPTNQFSDFDLDPRCLKVLQSAGISHPSPIQLQAIPAALTGRDLIATAQTGTGKTLAFVLPGLTRLVQSRAGFNRMLVLLPTRELCQQVATVMEDYCKALNLRCVPIYGGVGMHTQTQRLQKGCEVIVATPGRLLDHLSRNHIHFKELQILVFDEADRMLDMGFLPDIRRILKTLPRQRQNLMFSATFAPALERLARDMMRNPERISAGAISKPVDTVRQLVVPVRENDKLTMLLRLLKEESIDSGLIFMRTIQRTEKVGRALKGGKFKTAIIHGDLPQQQRQRALEGFRQGKYQLLAATDVAARGLDIDDVSHVINYDIPENADDYLHRIGRTARAAQEGDAITLVAPSDHAALAAIEETLGYNIERRNYEGAPKILTLYRPQDAPAPAAAKRRRGRSLLRRR